ncbi:MAG: Mth938-like domain-containing protein [Pseudomonadota bacterium]|nr:Mth938-like domain-containing protein [Pseudomonadota bacterium]MDE3037185.1 Mth938-like domain-containing protein [Pseudomonadota bacterium]
MDITPAIPQGKQIITGYGNGQFRIGGEVYSGPVLIFPDRAVIWGIKPGAPVTLANLGVVLEEEGEIDLLLIGTGKKQDVLPQGIRTALKDVGIALEIMDTGAAVRTYNVLLAEGRRVAAALVAV